MPLTRGFVTSLIGMALLMGVTACGPAVANGQAARQTQATTADATTPAQSGTKVWGKVPYCTCLAGAATAGVASAFKEADLTVSLQEVSPHEGWLYFVATFDSDAATLAQVSSAIDAGGGEVVAGPP